MKLVEQHLCCEGLGNLEWIEVGLRSALHADATRMLEGLLNDPQLKVAGDEKCPGEKRMGAQSKEVQCLFGKLRLRRNYYYDAQRGRGRYPLDEALGLHNGYTPGVARLICRAAGRDSYGAGSGDLKAYAGLEVSARQLNRMVERIGPQMRAELEAQGVEAETKAVPRLYVSCDGTGVPMRREELEDVAGKQPDGTAKTKEVKTGCVFTQHPVDGEEPFRDCDSTSYVATLRRCGEFGTLLRKEAFRRGMGRAGEIVFIADGAVWIWELARINFPGAVEILDYYHAREYLTEIVEILFGKKSEAGARKLEQWKDLFFEDKIEQVIWQARVLSAAMTGDAKLVNAKINYFENNKHRMKYGTYRQKGYFYGSGVIEAGCKSVIGKRAKQSGMFWSSPGVENVLAIRTALHSNRFDSYWDHKNAA